jgi:hypothetical protein
MDRKKIRKHQGINQQTGRLKKGYRYSGKTLKSGLPQIIKTKNIQKGGNNINDEVQILLQMIEEYFNNQNQTIKKIKDSDLLNKKDIKDLELKYEFLEVMKELIDNMIKLYVESQVLKDLYMIIQDQIDVISKVENSQPSGKKLKHDEKVMVANILKNKERIDPDIMSREIRLIKPIADDNFLYIKVMDDLLGKNFKLNPRTKKYTFNWNYKTDTNILKNKVTEIKKKYDNFKEKVDFKFILMILEENLNIFDGCYCNSTCTFQTTPDTPHWCYTQHERCKRGTQSKFGNVTKTCNPLRDNQGIMTGVDKNFYTIGKHNMVHNTNRAIICTVKDKGITKFSGQYKCSGSAMTIKEFYKTKHKEYLDNYSNVMRLYYKNMKDEILKNVKKEVEEQKAPKVDIQTKPKPPRIIKKPQLDRHKRILLTSRAILGKKTPKRSNWKGGERCYKKKNKK